jgi:hypothetical protein
MWRKLETRSGRWTTPDPYGRSLNVNNPQWLNRYAQVRNDPINFIDHTGLCLNRIQYSYREKEGGIELLDWDWDRLLCGAGDVPGEVGTTSPRRGPADRPNPVHQIFPPIDVDKLKGLIKERLEFSDCKEWVAALISKAAELSGGTNPAVGTNILETLDRVRNQPNGGFIFAFDPRVTGGGGTADGYWRNGSITIRITPLGYFSDNPHGADYIPIHYGLNGLHELVHASGQNAMYTEPGLLRAVQALDPNGEYHDWNTALKDHCTPPE